VAHGRFAPSPTGDLHLGNLRTALVAWLFARSSGGAFTVRMEDLDPVTSSKAKASRQLGDLADLGLDWDGDVVFQSERFGLYHGAIATLQAKGLTYPCFCSRREIAEALSAPHGLPPDARYPGTCRELSPAEQESRHREGRSSALRLRAVASPVALVDRIAGPFVANPDDVVLRRSDGMPAYNLAVVVDDELQGVDEVVRGDDLLPSTPSQIALGSELGFRRLSYAHVPLALGPTGQRLAKRDGAVTLVDLGRLGFSASEVLSRIAESLRLCDSGETVTASALVARFDPAQVPREPWLVTNGLLQA